MGAAGRHYMCVSIERVVPGAGYSLVAPTPMHRRDATDSNQLIVALRGAFVVTDLPTYVERVPVNCNASR